jgi:hypothetical protein
MFDVRPTPTCNIDVEETKKYESTYINSNTTC